MRVNRSSSPALKRRESASLSISEPLESRCLMSVSATGLSPKGVAAKASSYTLATFTTTDSPLKAANYSATVNFEDGSSGPAKIKFGKGVFSVVATHRYGGPGSFAAQVTINDKLDSTTQTVTSNVSVDPSHTGNGFTAVSPAQTPFFVTAFGGTWHKVGNNYTNHKLTAVRISDRKDITWSGNIQSVSVIPTSAVFTEQLGFISGTSGGSYVNLFNATGPNSTGGIGATAMPATYRFARTGDDNNVFSSNPADNVDKRDHMVTYLIKGLVGQPSGQTTYVLGWEDSIGTSDFDFKDLMVEVTLASGGPS
jgi:hypothetical protein